MQKKMPISLLCTKFNSQWDQSGKVNPSGACGISAGVLSKCSLPKKLKVTTGDEILERFCCSQHQRSCRAQECRDWLICVDRQQDTLGAMCLGQRIRGKTFTKALMALRQLTCLSLQGEGGGQWASVLGEMSPQSHKHTHTHAGFLS